MSQVKQCPKLYLAPMEGLGDKYFRKAMAEVGGFDEATTEFLRVPKNAHVPSLSKKYHAEELAPMPLAAQLMGENPDLLAEMTIAVAARGAPRIELNCGCPSNTVVGRGAGSSLLQDPNRVHELLKAMVQASPVPVSAKIRSGYENTDLFKENLFAAQESGICHLTIHPRTKKEGYGPPARWDLIAQAKDLLDIPIVGNGDIRSAEDARRMLQETHCDALMIGRGAVSNPWIFHEIRQSFSLPSPDFQWSYIEEFIRNFISYLKEDDATSKLQINKLKQISRYLLLGADISIRQNLLRFVEKDPEKFLELALESVKKVFV